VLVATATTFTHTAVQVCLNTVLSTGRSCCVCGYGSVDWWAVCFSVSVAREMQFH